MARGTATRRRKVKKAGVYAHACAMGCPLALLAPNIKNYNMYPHVPNI